MDKTTQLTVTSNELQILLEEIDCRCQEYQRLGCRTGSSFVLREKITAAIVELKNPQTEAKLAIATEMLRDMAAQGGLCGRGKLRGDTTTTAAEKTCHGCYGRGFVWSPDNGHQPLPFPAPRPPRRIKDFPDYEVGSRVG